MGARARVLAIVAIAAALAAAAVVGVTLLQTRGDKTTAAGAVTKPRAGVPSLWLDFGVRDDAETRALTGASRLLADGRLRAAAAVFGRYHSVPAQIGAAFARWHDGGLDAVKRVVAAHPDSPVAQFHLGMAYLWSGRVADAVSTWQRLDARHPDAPESVEAENLLYPDLAPGLPLLVTPLTLPSAPTAAAQLRLLARDASHPDANAKLRYGTALWRLDRRVSAERQFAAAARLAPHDPLALTLAAVGLFSKRDPVRAFSRLGPLTGVFPRAAVVRLHLGLLLVWTRRPAKGEQQLRLAVRDEPRSVYAVVARKILADVSK